MTTDSTEELLVQGLEELYYTEQQLVDALDTLAEETLREEEAALDELSQASEQFDEQQVAGD